MIFYNAFASLDINWTYKILFPSKWTRFFWSWIPQTYCTTNLFNLVPCRMQLFPPLVQVGIASSKGVWGKPSKCRLLDVKAIAVQNFESKYQGITWNNHPPCLKFGKPITRTPVSTRRVTHRDRVAASPVTIGTGLWVETLCLKPNSRVVFEIDMCTTYLNDITYISHIYIYVYIII